jgi:hypothetical protein
MVDRCSFCSSTAGPFGKVEGWFTVLMCADCQAVRGHGSGSYPVMTRAQMRAGLDQLPTWALEQKAAAFAVPACERIALVSGPIDGASAWACAGGVGPQGHTAAHADGPRRSGCQAGP